MLDMSLKCEECEKDFDQPGDLKKHKLIHLKDESNKMFDQDSKLLTYIKIEDEEYKDEVRNVIKSEELSTDQKTYSDEIKKEENESSDTETASSPSNLSQYIEEASNAVYIKEEKCFDDNLCEDKMECLEDYGKDFEESNPLSDKSDEVMLNTYLEMNDPLSNKFSEPEVHPEANAYFLQEAPTDENVSETQEQEDNMESKDKNKRKYTVNMSFECDTCQRRFRRPKDLENHKLLHSEVYTSGREKLYQCDECPKVFEKLPNLKSHKLSHNTGKSYKSDKPYKCTECDKGFRRSNDLMKHTRTHENKQCECLMCGKVCSRPDRLASHMKTHLNEEVNICKTCGKCFAHPHQLRKHELIHATVKPYKCDVCEQNFAHSTMLLKHKKIHAEKRFKCEICEKAFMKRIDLERHKVVHTGERPYKCKDCGKDFGRLGDLVRHGKIHTGERPYKCDICGKSFIESCKLKAHKNTHVEKKPCKCNVCEKTFSELVNLRRHQKHCGHLDATSSETTNEAFEVADNEVTNINELKNEYSQNYNYEGLEQNCTIVKEEEDEDLFQDASTSMTHNFGDLSELHDLYNNQDIKNETDHKTDIDNL